MMQRSSESMRVAALLAAIVGVALGCRAGAGGSGTTGDDTAGTPTATTGAATSAGPSGGATSGGTTSGGATGSSAGETGDPADCEVLFGAPVEATGLTAEQCRPSCPCLGDGWTPPDYDAAHIDDLAGRTLLDPPGELTANPYDTPDMFPAQPGKVCAVLLEPDQPGAYRVQTFDAGAAMGIVTHADACGLCSSLQDLAVYMRYPDLTDPVRACGVEGISGGEEANLSCLLDLGFTLPCAQIWLYNTINTRTECLDVCVDLLDDPYHLPDGSLNACLRCDEENSGPVFKAVAGRTRRNTGLASALCRPCDSVQPIVHVY